MFRSDVKTPLTYLVHGEVQFAKQLRSANQSRTFFFLNTDRKTCGYVPLTTAQEARDSLSSDFPNYPFPVSRASYVQADYDFSLQSESRSTCEAQKNRLHVFSMAVVEKHCAYR